jgi:hypothetical protein
MSNTTEKKRNLGVDVLCCLGVMMLLGLEYIRAVGFADAPIDSYMAALPIAARWFCLSGAMLLSAGTGYILSSRKFSMGYFRILIRLVYVYVICSLGGLAIRSLLLQETMTPLQMVQAFFSFTTTDTSRFAGMYFALLIAAPFLNAAFHDLKSRQARQVFLVVTAAFSTLQPTLQFAGVYVLPEWCKGLFPVAAYIGGAYMKRYSKRKDIYSLIIFLLSLCIAQTVVVLSVSMSKGIMYCPWLDSMASLPCLCIALSLLGIFRSPHEGTGVGHRFFALGADGALASLLLADPLLDCLMSTVEERFPGIGGRLWMGFAIVPMVFIICCTVGLILQTPLLLLRNSLRQDEQETEENAEESTDGMLSPEEEAAAASAYEADAVEEEGGVVLPEHMHTQPVQNAAENSSLHTIKVPVRQPQVQVRLTQPADEMPLGVHEVSLPENPAAKKRDYTLDEILSEQGIPVKHMPESVDDLIAELSK